VPIGKRSVEIGQRCNVRLAPAQILDDLAHHPGQCPSRSSPRSGTGRHASRGFPQISAKRLFHQINLNSARRVCSLSVLFSVTSDETFLATTLSRFFRSRYTLTRLVELSDWYWRPAH
jgi:hypothetical protein